MSSVTRIRAIDSHTAGEPTRLIVDGFPDLGNGTMAERLAVFSEKYDDLRVAMVCEPRGHDAVVGALLCEPSDPANTCGVIFFNNVGFLGMCGHGSIGLVRTLEYMGRITPDVHKIETPVGLVEAKLDEDGSVSIINVPSYRYKKDVAVDVPDIGRVTGDIAYGGNWFFLVHDSSRIDLANLESLTARTVAIRTALQENKITGADRAEIDHIELFGASATADSRSFVLCPGLEYDRSPCGTGTSAKLACLYADGKLAPGETWRQESIIGGVFEGSVTVIDDKIVPTIKGTAFVTAELELIFDPADPFRGGIAA
ncbi:MAG TPA: 4-hydroxyproline epimerase [Pyrinomonadaceae bacterium]|jgi:4-hydroxyproline epimerase